MDLVSENGGRGGAAWKVLTMLRMDVSIGVSMS